MMTRKKRWSELEVSAYLDGALTPQDQAALEADVARDPDLHERVEALRGLTTMVRAMPMRQTPRNYLLTSAMVAEKVETKPARRRRPLWAMRLATSVVAAAFVISFGLTLVQQGLTPNRMLQSEGLPQSDGLPSAALMEEYAPADDAETALVEAEALDVPAEAEEAPEAARMEPRPTLSPEDEMALAPMTESVEMAEVPAEGEGYGVGGGEPAVEDPAALPPRPPETPLAVEEEIELEAPDSVGALEAPAPEAEADPEAEALTAPLADTEADASQIVTTEVEKRVEVDGADAPETVADGARAGVQARRTTSVGITIGLGIATALLAIVTLWISRRQAR